MQRTVTVETATTMEGIAGLRPCYERLLRATGNTLPFALHEWHVVWVKHFLNRNPRIRDEPLFYVLRDSAGVCVAIIPFIVSRRRVGPFKIVSVDLLGADPAITEIRAPMIEPGYEVLAARAVQHQLASIGDWDWIHWTGLSESFARALAGGDPTLADGDRALAGAGRGLAGGDRASGGGRAPAGGGSLQWRPPLLDYVLDMAPTWEQFRLRLKRNIRESLRHCYNSLKRDNHPFELQVIEGLPELRPGLDRFLELHRMRADLTTTVPHPNRFASPISRDFLYEVCEHLSKSGSVRLFALKVASQIVAMRIGFAVGDSLYLYYSGFDPAWARYSVMTTTLAEAIKYAIAQGFKTVNLSPAPDIAKTRWSPRQLEYRSAYQQGSRLRSRLARRAYMKARSGAGLQSRLLQQLIPARRHWF